MKKVYIITNFYWKIPQKLHETESIEVDTICEFLSSKYQVEKFRIEDFSSKINEIDYRDSLFIYTSSQYADYKNYINDILVHIHSNGGVLVPRYEIFYSHENKIFQSFEMNKLKIPTPKWDVVSSLDDFEDRSYMFDFPSVFKAPFGFASDGVAMVKNKYDALKFIKKHTFPIFKKGKNLIRNKKLLNIYEGKYPLRPGRILSQEFIADCSFDWKVLVFYDKYFVLKRYTKDGDFRASGSGKFDIDPELVPGLLDFAKECFESLLCPFISMDIINYNGMFYLIEYQGVHFGTYTMMKTKKYYTKNTANEWQINDESKINKTQLFAYSYFKFIEDMENSL